MDKRHDINLHERNLGTITREEQLLLAKKKVCVVGCGGLGGYVIELLARIGIGQLTIIDGDTFSESNLNRQLYSRMDNLDASKALEAARRCMLIAPRVKVAPIKLFLNESNAYELLRGHDLLIDALDNAPSRLLMESACEKLNIAIIHAAVKEWNAQISLIYPGDKTLANLYSGDLTFSMPSVPSFTPAFAAAIEVSEAVKFLLARGETLRSRMLLVDLLTNTFDIVQL